MDNYRSELTENTPLLDLNHSNHTLVFEGDSRPEDVQKFFNPVLEWLDNYANYVYFLKDKSSSPIEINCNFKFEYFNSSSAKYIMDIIVKLGEIQSAADSIKLNVNWYYDEMDEDMEEAGEEFADMVGVKFNMVTID